MRRAFAHGEAAKDGGFEQQRLGSGGKLDIERPGEGRSVEDDGLLRQPGDAAALADGQLHPHFRAVGCGAVDLLAGLGGYGRRGASADIDLPAEAVTAGQPACGVDQDRFKRIGRDRRHPDLGGTVLIETAQARAAATFAAAEPCRASDALGRQH